jgi:PAS domain S-box-containing protein
VHDIVKCEYQDGKPADLRGFMIDISERKQNEAALRESEERMTLAMSAANLGLWTWDVVRDEVWVTPEGRRFFGWEKSDVINFERFIETLHPDDREATRRAISRSLDRGDDYTVEYRVVLRDGGIRWIATLGRVEFTENGRPLRMLGVAVDMTARKHSEEALRESEERFRTMADTAPVMIWMAGVNKLCTFFNKRWLDFTGRALEQELGKGWAENVHHEDLDRCLEMYTNSFDARREFTMEYRLRRHDGEYRWVLDNGVPRLGPDGTFLGYIGTAIDITQRKDAETELQRNRQELAHVTRISTMGELAASLAHELNQPLTAILSNAQAAQRFLAAKPSDLQEVHEILKDIVQDNSRAGEVIQRMRVLVKKGELAFVPLDIASVIRDVVALVRSDAILHSVRVVLEFNGGLPLARGDRVQLQQVVLNLLLNAFDAMKDLPASEREVSLRAELDSAGMLAVSVRDRGIGISGAKVDKIFEPFYTTKRDGLGMGLSISRSIIEAHGGRLWVENNQERGTTFHFTILTEAKVER